MGRKLQSHRGASSTDVPVVAVHAGQPLLRRQHRLEQRRQPDVLLQHARRGVRLQLAEQAVRRRRRVGREPQRCGFAIRPQATPPGPTAPIATTGAASQFDWTGTWFRDNWAGGNHSLKFGVVSEREGQYFREEGFVGHYRTHFNSTGGARDFTTPYRVQIYNTPQESEDYTWHHGGFFNDSFQKGRVTLNVGAAVGLLLVLLPRSGDSRGAVPGLLLRRRGACRNGYASRRTPYAGDLDHSGESGLEQVLVDRAARWDGVGPVR